MEGNQLVFSENGKTASIKFKTGFESLDFDTKEEALGAIRDCYAKGKISKEEQDVFIEQIVLAKDMPSVPAGFSSFTRALNSALFGDNLHEEKIENPYTEMCNCDIKTPHAYIYNGNGEIVSLPFRFKSEGLVYVTYLQRRGCLSEKDTASLHALIDLLPLPEDPSLN
ncbi:MAG TPA: hypothetical protein VG621_01150 [Candidatus Paceibacterota bacterium]|nr:hypothetical protein [Candidatus Paceibacterota bacterium]